MTQNALQISLLHKYIKDPHYDKKICLLKYWKVHKSISLSLAEVAKTVLSEFLHFDHLFSVVSRSDRCRIADGTFRNLCLFDATIKLT